MDTKLPSTDSESVAALLARCPHHKETALRALPELAQELGVASLEVKDETTRMGLGSFKALGAAYVIAREAEAGDVTSRCFVAASAGNHGMSVAAGAKAFGAKAVILLAETVPESFAARLRDQGAEVIRAGTIYEESLAEAERLAEVNGWTMLADGSCPHYQEIPYRVMEGYTQMAEEISRQIKQPPTHIFLQAGVGGLAAAVAAYARRVWTDGPKIIVVEPEFAPAVIESIRAGKVITTKGPVSDMGRLDCKEPSLVAFAGLSRDADAMLTISEEPANNTVDRLAGLGISTTSSGAAGVAGAMDLIGRREAESIGLDQTSRILCVVSEVGDA